MRINRFVIMLLLLAFTTGAGFALDVLQENVCVVEADETITGHLYALCLELTIDGTVEGSVFAAAVNAQLNGRIDGDVYLLAGDAALNGTLGRDVHVAAGVITFTEESAMSGEDANLIAASLSTRVPQNITITGDVVAMGYQLVMEGAVGGSLDFAGSAFSLNNTVGGDVQASVGDSNAKGTASQIQTLLVFMPFKAALIDPGLTLRQDARVGGSLEYRAYQPMESAASEQVSGQIVYEPIVAGLAFEDLANEERRSSALGEYFEQVLRDVTTLSLLGLFMLALTPGFLQTCFSEMRQRSLTHVGVGLLAFTLSFPVLLLVLALSLLIIVLLSFVRIDGLLVASGVLFGLVDIGGASVFYFTAIYLSRTLVAFAIGRWLVYRFTRSSTVWAWLLSLAVGTFILSMLFALPVVGFVVNALALFWGLGVIFAVVQGQIRKLRETAPMPAPEAVIATATPSRTPAPPIVDVELRPRGTDNLPEGFAWWSDDD